MAAACHSVPQEYLPKPGGEKHLDWDIFKGHNFEVFSHQTIGDGHCLLHTVINAISVVYRTGYQRGLPISRTAWIVERRRRMAKMLDEIDPKTGKIYYESIGNGEIAILGKSVPFFSKRGLQKLFYTSQYLGDESITILAYMLNINIIVLNMATKDVMIFGLEPDPNLSGVVAHYTGNHYELVSVRTSKSQGFVCHFDPEHTFMKFLRDRIKSFKKP